MITGLTPTAVLRYIHRALGSSVQALELSDRDIMQVVYQNSLPLYSEYFPFKPYCILNPKDRIEGQENLYRIPNPFGLQLTGAYRVISNQYLYAGTGYFGFIPNINPFDASLTDNLRSLTITPITFDFFPPNAVRIQPAQLLVNDVVLQFTANHPRHLKTIDSKMREDFCLLCLYDVLLAIRPIRKRFATINTAFGSLEPFNEMVDSAESNRNDLLNKRKEEMLYAGDALKFVIS